MVSSDRNLRVVSARQCTLTLLSGPKRGKVAVVAQEVFRIGKSPANDLVLNDSTVSRKHCEIIQEAGGFLVRDLNSTNGTLLDGAEVREAFLKPGAVLTVGAVELKIRPYTAETAVEPSEQNHFHDVVGCSEAIRQVFGLLTTVAKRDSSVLLTGEPGTGKLALAKALHEESTRRQGPLVIVDCEVSRQGLTIFGGERSRAGALERAAKGTLVLRHIEHLGPAVQSQLALSLSSRAIKRTEGPRIPIDVRVVATSRVDIAREVQRGRFVPELRGATSETEVMVPPLRQRIEDIPLILRAHGKSDALAEVLSSAPLYNNAHELLQWADIMATHGGGRPPLEEGKSYRDTKAEWDAAFEKHYVASLLEEHNGNVSAAARAADMDRKYLHKLAKRHGLRD